MSEVLGTVLSDGSESGVAPRSDLPRLLIEGWRFLPHSYSIVNEQHCLELLGREDVGLRFREAPRPPYLGQPVMEILDTADQEKLAAMIPPQCGERFDAVLRMDYPYDFAPAPAETFVFVTCERGLLKPHDVLNPPQQDGATVRHFARRIRENGVTVITPSEWSKRGLARSGIDADRIVVVPHGMNPAVFHPLDHETRTARRTSRGYGDYFTFLHVSAMTGNKNVEGLILAFLEVARRHPNARLVLKGLDGLFKSNKWISQELGRLSEADRLLAKRTIAYCGTTLSLKNQSLIYQLADCYVAPYQSEGFCIPVLEAAACGVPSIATAGGPTDEFTTRDFLLPVDAELGDHMHDGYLWFRTDHDSLVAQMERAITDREWMASASRAAAEHAHSRYSWAVVVDALLDAMNLKGSHVRR